jgi:hypothetical protein
MIFEMGLCLNKLCHWAYDAGIVRLDWKDEKYILSVPDEVKNVAPQAGLDLDYFLELEGPIQEKNLPKQKNKWPLPIFLEKLNESMFQ